MVGGGDPLLTRRPHILASTLDLAPLPSDHSPPLQCFLCVFLACSQCIPNNFSFLLPGTSVPGPGQTSFCRGAWDQTLRPICSPFTALLLPCCLPLGAAQQSSRALRASRSAANQGSKPWVSREVSRRPHRAMRRPICLSAPLPETLSCCVWCKDQPAPT